MVPRGMRRLECQRPGAQVTLSFPRPSSSKNCERRRLPREQMVCVFCRAQKTGDLGARRSLWFLKWGGPASCSCKACRGGGAQPGPHLTRVLRRFGSRGPGLLLPPGPEHRGIQPLPGKAKDAQIPYISGAPKVEARQNSVAGKAPWERWEEIHFILCMETVILTSCKCSRRFLISPEMYVSGLWCNSGCR